MGFGLRTPNHNRVSIVYAPAIYYWHELNPKTDIVLNLQLKQIYPYNTGKMPMVIEQAFQADKNVSINLYRRWLGAWNVYRNNCINDKGK